MNAAERTASAATAPVGTASAGTAVVICAAGSSSRMGGIKKEYQMLERGASLTVLGSVVRAFSGISSVEMIVIAVGQNEETNARGALPPECLASEKPKIFFVKGGESRRASVFNALLFLAPYNPSYVLIHDGARPWVSPSLIQNVIDAVQKYGAAVPLAALTDTPKECDAPFDSASSGGEPVFVKSHLKRAHTGIAQTPQGFRFAEILSAHEKAAACKGEEFTDDAQVWGRFCGQVAVVAGSPENRKITFPGDIR